MTMARTHKKLWQMVLTLVLVTALSGGLLSFFYGWMHPMIEARQEEEVISLGLRGVFPQVERYEVVELDELPENIEAPVYRVFDATGSELGYVFNAHGQGWGAMRLAVGVDASTQKVAGVVVLEHQETPGLGSAIEEDWFLDQFKGKPLSDPFTAGGDVEMITGATASTRGVATTVAENARGLLAALGLEVDVEEAVADGTIEAKTPGIPGPRYLGNIEELAAKAGLAEEITVEPADLWEVVVPDDGLTALSVRTTTEGYGGPVSVLVLVDAKTGHIVGIDVLSHNETPGIGSEIEQAYFLDQFLGKGPEAAFTVFDDIDALTMATVSTEAVAEGAKRAVEAVRLIYGLK